jgi:2-methylcitrate dehydratase
LAIEDGNVLHYLGADNSANLGRLLERPLLGVARPEGGLPTCDSSPDCSFTFLMTTTLAHQLANYATSLRYEDLSEAVIHEVKRRVIDSLGCALGAWSEEPCVIARNVASEFSAKNGATIIGTDHQAPPDWAAFATGCCIRYFDYNDTYLSKEPAHPSDNIAAALASAESVGANGRELITAIALAYEVQCRLCDAASIRARGWDHVTYGAFSTALAAAKLMKLDLHKTRHAVNIAGVACAAMRQARVGELSHWKGVAFANAARHGVYSALLARAGMTGPAPIFEGQMGFEKQLGVSLGDVGSVFVKRPRTNAPHEGTASMILNTSIKYWPAEYHSQSAIEAALFLRKQIDDLSQIQSVVIESHDASVDIIGSEPEKWKPETRETADHSLPYITAIALLDGEVTSRQFEPERFADPATWKFLESVKVERNAKLSAMYPGAVANIVHVTLSDGRTLTKRVDYPLGHAKNPLKDSEVEGKFQFLVAPALGENGAKKILQHAWKLDAAKDVGELMSLVEMPA